MEIITLLDKLPNETRLSIKLNEASYGSIEAEAKVFEKYIDTKSDYFVLFTKFSDTGKTICLLSGKPDKNRRKVFINKK